MQLSSSIRKEILQALDGLIPALAQQSVPIGYVFPPLEFPPAIKSRLIEARNLRASANVEYPVVSHWPAASMLSLSHPYIGIIYEGAAEERTLVTTTQSHQYNIPSGIHAIRWEAPGVLVFPPGAPHNSSARPLWEEDNKPLPTMRILWIGVSPELLLHTHVNGASMPRRISHSLQINDRSITSLITLFIHEFPTASKGDQRAAQAILLAAMLRLQQNLRCRTGTIANTAYSQIQLAASGENEICREAVHFIQMHLHESLTLPGIAQKLNVSPNHLNRLFNDFCGVSVMRYVRNQRIATAKQMLELAPENVGQIARLTGFRHTAHFCDVFKRSTGHTPNLYRRKSRQANNK